MFLNVIQLAESLGVEESVVQGWVRNDGLPCVRDAGRLLFDRAQVTAWAAERGLAARTGFLAPTPSKSAGLPLGRLLRTGGIWRDVAPEAVISVLEQVVNRLPGTTSEIRRILAQRLEAPNGVTWAPVGGGLALPHLRSHVALGREAGLLALLFLKAGLSLAEPPVDGAPVTRLAFFVAPSPRAHLEMLAQLSSALVRGDLRQLVMAGAGDEKLFAAIERVDAGKGPG